MEGHGGDGERRRGHSCFGDQFTPAFRARERTAGRTQDLDILKRGLLGGATGRMGELRDREPWEDLPLP